MEDESIVYSGNHTVSNEILFVFDYSCSWCHLWIDDIFPEVSKLIEKEVVKFRTQSMALLDDISLQLTKFDQNIKEHYPDKYFDIFGKIIADGKDNSYTDLLTDQYIDLLVNNYQLDEDILLAESNINIEKLTNIYTEELALESVPTIIVNGEKVEDPFNFKEIKKLLH